MRYFLLIILFSSFDAFSASAWVSRLSLKDDANLQASLCSAHNDVAVMGHAWRVIPYAGSPSGFFQCQTNSNPCDLPQIWDQITFSCREPCESVDIGSRTFSPASDIVCVDDCEVIQTGDSVCTGTELEGGTCTAPFAKSGSFCPVTSYDPSIETPPDTGGGGDTGGGDTGGGDTGGGGGDTGGGGGDTGGGGGDTGGGGGDTGGGDTGGGDTGGGDTGGTGSGGSASGGGDCEAPPQCTNPDTDQTRCAQLLQEYYQRCPSTDLLINGDGTGTGEYTKNIGNRVAGSKQAYEDKFNEITNDLMTNLSLSISGGGALSCESGEIKGQTLFLNICARQDFLDLISGLFMAVASILSVYIILARH